MKGIIPPVVTLLDAEGQIDIEKNKVLLNHIIEAGVHGLVLLGSSGEFPHFSLQEKKDYLSAIVPEVKDRLPVLVGTGGTVLEDTIELTRHAHNEGATGALVVNPYYWTMTDEQMYEYFAAVAQNVDMDIYLYNIPQLTGQNIDISVIKKLAENFQNIRGIKETVASISRIRKVINEVKSVREDFYVYSAFDDQLLDAQLLGAAGSINGTAVFLPELSVNLYHAIQQKDFETIQALHVEISGKMDLYEWHPSFYLSMKEAVYARWFPKERVNMRTPFVNTELDLRPLAEKLVGEYAISGGIK